MCSEELRVFFFVLARRRNRGRGGEVGSDHACLDRRWRMKWQLFSDRFAPELLRHSLTWFPDTKKPQTKAVNYSYTLLSLSEQVRFKLLPYQRQRTVFQSFVDQTFFPQSQNLNHRLVTQHKLGPSTRQHCSTSGIHTTVFFSAKLGISLSFFAFGLQITTKKKKKTRWGLDSHDAHRTGNSSATTYTAFAAWHTLTCDVGS